MKLYELPRDKGVKLYGYIYHTKPTPIIFGHIDGMYSYCWIEGHEDEVIHLSASTELEPYKDGYLLPDIDKEEYERMASV